MKLDWQSIIVALSILGAIIYVGSRGLKRLRAFGAAKSGSASCETGCGSCDGAATSSTPPASTLIQIKGSGTPSGQQVKHG